MIRSALVDVFTLALPSVWAPLWTSLPVESFVDFVMWVRVTGSNHQESGSRTLPQQQVDEQEQ